jgi:Cu(I)/Ag(I) efflux system membrane fusion protein
MNEHMYRNDEGGLRAPPGLGFWGRLWWWLKFWVYVKTARLRFIVVLVAVGGVIAYWDTLQAYYEKWSRPGSEQAHTASDLEFWCPMHPAVIREQPDKCPICNMPLSKRKKGDKSEDEGLPPGVISRVQLTPYRIALAGIQTAEVAYRPLQKEIRAAGTVEFDERRLTRITVRVTGKSRIDKLYVNVTGQKVHPGDPVADLYSPDLVNTVDNLLQARRLGNATGERDSAERLRRWGIDDDQIAELLRNGKPVTHVTIRSPMHGHIIKKYQTEGEYVEEGARLFDVADLETVWIEAQVYEDELAFLTEGLEVTATTKAYPSRTFRGKVAFVHPHLDTATRTLRVRFDMVNPRHNLRPGMYATVKLEVPVIELELFTNARAERWRDGIAGDGLAQALFSPALPLAPVGLGPLVDAAVERTLAVAGLVLTVPEHAVIDTGNRKIVYRETEPGVFDGLQVQLGPRAGDYYPLVAGLVAGDRVATHGSFLIDAETRLSGGAGSTYFGAAGGPVSDKKPAGSVRPSMGDDEETKAKAIIARMSPDDQKLVEAQKFCPVLKQNRLGSMGRPVKLMLNGQPVFLCCKGCENQAREHADRTLQIVSQLKSGPPLAAPAPAPSEAEKEEIEIREALAKLSPEDRKLAETQRFCAVDSNSRLGSMDVPAKIMLQGRPVFLCCKGCERRARQNPDATLATVEKLTRRASEGGPR